MENRNFYIISILILLLIGLFMIPIAGLLIDPAPEPNYLDTPMEELNGYSLRQVYENDLYIDDNLTVLNNHTLREVFEGANYLYNRNPNTIDMTKVQSVTYIDNGFEILSNATTSTFITITFNQALNNGDKLYSYGESFSTSNSKRFQIQTSPPNFDILNKVISSTYSKYSQISTLDSNKTEIKFQASKLTTDINITQGYKNYGVVNMTTLGITTLTVTQMDYFFNLYRDILASAVFGNYINEYGIYANGSYINDMTTFGLENMSLSKHNYYYDLYQYYSSFEN
jgi:hypothetical protein